MNHSESAPDLSVIVSPPGYAPAPVSTPLFRLDDRARPAPSLARFALGPSSLVLAFALFYGGHVSQLAAMCIVGAGLISFQWASVIANASRDAYDRAAVGLLAKGKASELGARLETAYAFRVFGPSAERAARRGAVLSAAGKYPEAAKEWARAIAGYASDVVPRAVGLGFASAAFEAGWNRDASRAYRALFDGDPDLPRVRMRLAHALARLGEDLEEADALLTTEEKTRKQDDVELRVARAAWLAASKKPKAAREKLEGLGEVPGFLAAEVDALRERPAKKRSA